MYHIQQSEERGFFEIQRMTAQKKTHAETQKGLVCTYHGIIILISWLMESGGSMPHPQELFYKHYPEPNQCNLIFL